MKPPILSLPDDMEFIPPPTVDEAFMEARGRAIDRIIIQTMQGTTRDPLGLN